MRNPGPIAKFAVSTALFFSLTAFVLGSAPFTPALVLAIVAVPVALATSFYGTWRLSAITIYWAIAAFSAVPLSNALPIYTDTALVLLGLAGLLLSGVLYFNYARAKPFA